MSALVAAKSAERWPLNLKRTHETWGLRIATVLVAALIIYLRMPDNFSRPQFWAEDGAVFFRLAHEIGTRALLTPVAGYFITMPWLVALGAKLLSPEWAPWIYNYAGAGIALFAVYLATSPRLDLPLKPLLALAIVTVPDGGEILGALANSMWIMPIVTFIILFMRPGSTAITIGEGLFVALQGVTGPFSPIFLPLFVVRLLMVRGQHKAYRRLLLLTIIMAMGALIQIATLYFNRDTGSLGFQMEPIPYPWQLWITLPFKHWFKAFGPGVSSFFLGGFGVPLAIAAGSIAGLLAFRAPYRDLKIMMGAFALVVALSGMIKVRLGLGYMIEGGDRYFYIGAVFLFWFIACAAPHGRARHAATILIVAGETISVFNSLDLPRQRGDLEWPVWANYLSAGIPVRGIPVAPQREFSIPASAGGPLAAFVAWPGKTLAELGQQANPSGCQGAFENFDADPYRDPLRPEEFGKHTTARGWAWNNATGSPPRLVVMVDGTDRVVGLGLPGFKNRGDASQSFPQSGWVGTLVANDPTTVVRAYAVLADGQGVCPLAHARSARYTIADFTVGAFTHAIALTPGTKVVQRFGGSRGRLSTIALRTVNWGKIASPYVIEWRVVAIAGDSRRVIGSGEMSTQGSVDWQVNELAVSPLANSGGAEIELQLFVPPNQDVTSPIGVPFHRMAPELRGSPANVDGKPYADDLVLALIARGGG
jgi:hypothetical protein